MSRFTDQRYLLGEQYKDDKKLDARIRLHKKFSTNDYGWMTWVFDRIQGLPSGSRILELGCGPGGLWQDNAHRIPAGWHITLSDFSPGMLAKAQKVLGDLARPFQFKVVDAQAIPFDDERFDAVIANHMLFFVPDRPKAFSEISRVLKPGGRLFATTVGRDYLDEIHELTARFDPDVDTGVAADQFGLENGPTQLQPYFKDVTIHIYDDSLLITEAEPLVDAVLSSDRSNKIRANPGGFVDFVRDEIARNGPIHVTKEIGMLVARKEGREKGE